MALIEQITQMKTRGVSEPQIIKALKEQGNSPLEINEALSQSNVKSAIANASSVSESMGEEEMMPSIMQQSSEAVVSPSPEEPSSYPAESQQYEQPPVQGQYQPEQYYQPSSQDYASQEQEYQQEVPYAPEQSAQEQYNQEAYYPQQTADIETIKDITQQIIEEELSKIRSQLAEISKIKSEIAMQMQELKLKISSFESVFQEILPAVRQISKFESSIKDISEELQLTQDSFSKLVNPIIDSKRGISRQLPAGSQIPAQAMRLEAGNKEKIQKTNPNFNPRQKMSKKPSFEDYFR